MTSGIGQNIVDSLGKKDLNQDGNIINLAIVGSSRFYDFQIFEFGPNFNRSHESLGFRGRGIRI